jgi:hypothetical protein
VLLRHLRHRPANHEDETGASMKWQELSNFARRAILVTLGGCVCSKNDSSPTWDGNALFLDRMPSETHVLHEVAHWLLAPECRRWMPNYGIGRDPDGGPDTPIYGGMTSEEVDLEEGMAATLTIVLVRLAGGDWYNEMRRSFLPEDERMLWSYVYHITLRGIDVYNPLSSVWKGMKSNDRAC